jgi:hypothetical protein
MAICAGNPKSYSSTGQFANLRAEDDRGKGNNIERDKLNNLRELLPLYTTLRISGCTLWNCKSIAPFARFRRLEYNFKPQSSSKLHPNSRGG